MITDWLIRTQLLIGEESLKTLTQSNVLIVGMGGVGSYAAEFICRAGIGKMTIVDGDVVDRSNRNRQLPATFSTEGKDKVEIMKARLLDINPQLNLTVIKEFIIPEKIKDLLSKQTFDYVIDAIDSLTPKLYLIATAYQQKIPIISSMGAGGKLDPTKLQVSDISKTHKCKLAKFVRKRLRSKFKIKKGIKVVYSTENVIENSLQMTDGSNFKKSYYGTISYLPAAFGGVCASVVVQDLIQKQKIGEFKSQMQLYYG
jgi:tRNA A37 threonylcarbamoyladenosine dehydratase